MSAILILTEFQLLENGSKCIVFSSFCMREVKPLRIPQWYGMVQALIKGGIVRLQGIDIVCSNNPSLESFALWELRGEPHEGDASAATNFWNWTTRCSSKQFKKTAVTTVITVLSLIWQQQYPFPEPAIWLTTRTALHNMLCVELENADTRIRVSSLLKNVADWLQLSVMRSLVS